MKRRNFIKGLLGTAAVVTVPAIAKQPTNPLFNGVSPLEAGVWNDFKRIIRIESGSADYAQNEIIVHGLDQNFKVVREVIKLEGIKPVVSEKVFF